MDPMTKMRGGLCWRWRARSADLSALITGFSVLKKQEHMAILQPDAYPSAIPARFWPESRNTADWIPAKDMPE